MDKNNNEYIPAHRIGTDTQGNTLYACPPGHSPSGECYLDEDGLVVVPRGEQYDVRPD